MDDIWDDRCIVSTLRRLTKGGSHGPDADGPDGTCGTCVRADGRADQGGLPSSDKTGRESRGPKNHHQGGVIKTISRRIHVWHPKN